MWLPNHIERTRALRSTLTVAPIELTEYQSNQYRKHIDYPTFLNVKAVNCTHAPNQPQPFCVKAFKEGPSNAYNMGKAMKKAMKKGKRTATESHSKNAAAAELNDLKAALAKAQNDLEVSKKKADKERANREKAKTASEKAASAENKDEEPEEPEQPSEIDKLRAEFGILKKPAVSKKKNTKEDPRDKSWRDWRPKEDRVDEEKDDKEDTDGEEDDPTPLTKQQRTLWDNHLQGLPDTADGMPTAVVEAYKKRKSNASKNVFRNNQIPKGVKYSDTTRFTDAQMQQITRNYCQHSPRQIGVGFTETEILSQLVGGPDLF